MTRAKLLLASALLLSGCSAFRLQAGIGFGFGADVQALGVTHAGFMFGRWTEYGLNYGRGPKCKTGYIVLGPWHSTRQTFEDGRIIEHMCPGILPGAFGPLTDDPPAEPWALEVGLGLFAIELRMGVNPVAPLFHEEPDPTAPKPWEAQPRPEPEPTAATGEAPPAGPAPADAQGPCPTCGARRDVCGCPR